MADVKTHYDTHLAHFYGWMLGNMQDRVEENLALAQLGYRVKAVDFSRVLLDELSAVGADSNIEVLESDILDVKVYEGSNATLILCMGDTLTHLQSEEEVDMLIGRAAKALASGGKLMLSFRDYSAASPGETIFIPVKSDADRILTCVLQYADKYVNVYDLLHEKQGDTWQQKLSGYRKLRLSAEWVRERLAVHGLKVIRQDVIKGMIHLLAEK